MCGRLTSRALGTGLKQAYTYYEWDDTALLEGQDVGQGGRLKSLTVGPPPGPPSLQNLTYVYDAAGNVRTISDAITSEAQTFGYDALDRLTSAAVTNGPAPYSEAYTYDATTGNLASKAGVNYTYNSGHAHAASQAGTNTYQYDANGNMTTRRIGEETYNLGYDAEGRMVSVTGPSVTAAFVYDGDGKRVQSTINLVTTSFVGNYYEVTGSTATKYYYAGGQRIAMRQGTTLYYLLADHLGSTTVTTDAGGNLVSELRYKAWGEVRYANGSAPTKYTYTGQYSNTADFGLMYYKARWYDPALSRFTSADTIGVEPGSRVASALTVDFHELPLVYALNRQTHGARAPISLDQATESANLRTSAPALDRYAYASNNPLRFRDPTGHCIWDLCVLEIVGLSFGVVELLAVAGATTLGVYVYGPGGRERVEAFSTSVASSLSNLTEEFGALFVKKADNRFIDYIAGKYGLTRAERRALHDLMTKQGLTPEEIEAEAVELVRSRHQHEQPDARESGNGGGNSGEQE